jgi:nucleotide-binding universal stress UspA family protein
MGVTVIVANETLGGAELRAAVEERMVAGGERFHLIVPVPHSPSPMIAVGLATAEVVMINDLDLPDQREIASQRLAQGLAWLRERGCAADGETVTGDPVDAVRDVVARGTVAEVIVSTLPSRISRWLRQDLPSRIGRAVDVPVVVVTPDDDDPTEQQPGDRPGDTV